jgi:hypothetical protein
MDSDPRRYPSPRDYDGPPDMALFPKCNFKVLLPNGVVTAGTRLDGVLELDVPEDIPRADHVHLFFSSKAWVGYGGGKNRTVYRRDLYLAPMIVELPKDVPLARGTYRYPFALDVPAWLPPFFPGNDCAIEHAIEARLDVDWAVDPKTRYVPLVVVPPSEGVHEPKTIRSPIGFHDEIVIEVSLGSTVKAQDEPLTGSIALRSGHAARFDAVILYYQSVATMRMGRGDRRDGGALSIRIPAERLRGGDSVPFAFPPDTQVPPTWRNGFIDHDVVLRVNVDIPWRIDPAFEVPLHVLPAGSTVHGDANAYAVGGERLREISSAMAQATGLRPGRPPVFIEGNVGAATLHVADGPREGRLGIEVDITFPDVDLGIAFRQLGMLEGFRSSPLLPAPLDQRYLLRVESEEKGRPAVPEEALRAFLQPILGDLKGADEVRLSDHHLGMHFPLANDGTTQMVDIARFAEARAKKIIDLIGALPFPSGLEAARGAWQAIAAEQSAFLAPSGPSLYGIVFRSKVVGGEERVMGAAIRTTWKDGAVLTRIDIDLRTCPITKDAIMEIERGGDRLRAVRATFPTMHALSLERAVLERPGFTEDPRTLLAGIEAFFFYVLETRAERRADQPYR